MSNEYKFSKDHEWVKVEGSLAYVGISHYAQNSLGDIVYVELPGIGSTVTAFEEFGSVESVKAVSELISPITGKVSKVNEELNDAPELLNEDSYKNWIIAVEDFNEDDFKELMNKDEYDEFLSKES